MGAFMRVPYAFFPKKAVAKTVVPRTDLLIAIFSAMHLLSQGYPYKCKHLDQQRPRADKKKARSWFSAGHGRVQAVTLPQLTTTHAHLA